MNFPLYRIATFRDYSVLLNENVIIPIYEIHVFFENTGKNVCIWISDSLFMHIWLFVYECLNVFIFATELLQLFYVAGITAHTTNDV